MHPGLCQVLVSGEVEACNLRSLLHEKDLARQPMSQEIKTPW